MATTDPTFATLRVGEVIHTGVQAFDPTSGAIRMGGIAEPTVQDDSTDVVTLSNATADPDAGTSEADVTAVGPGTRNLSVVGGGVNDAVQPVTVLDASALVVVQAGTETSEIVRIVDDGDTLSITVTARLVDVRHVPGLAGEPTYTGTSFLWEKDASVGDHYLKFDNTPAGPGHTEDDTGTVQTVAILIEGPSNGRDTFRVNVSAHNATGDTISGTVTIRMRQASRFGAWSFTPLITAP